MKIQQIIETEMDPEYTVMPYSGRGMYGKECLGVAVRDVAQFCFDLGQYVACAYFEEGETGDMERITNIKTDNLGLKYVVYFPNIRFEGDYDGEEEED